jgi:predicted RecB family nuclease
MYLKNVEELLGITPEDLEKANLLSVSRSISWYCRMLESTV